MIIGISPGERNKNRLQLQNKLKTVHLVFILTLLLPAFIYALFYYDVFTSRSGYSATESDDIMKPVALVITSTGTGTAFLVGETTLFTARHVVKEQSIGEIVMLEFDKAPEIGSCEAEIAWYPSEGRKDLTTDVAVLKLLDPNDIPDGFPKLILGTSFDVEVMDEVIILGYPNSDFTVTQGSVSNDRIDDFDLFKLDVEAFPGNSGGPLISKDNQEVIGILIAGMVGDFQGINAALKVDNILDILSSSNIDFHQ